ncbi:MAG: menaquinone biosynthesis protein [Bacteroidales bacterium]|nr:menaquinone biosynthesis protein [Bacteroidales bacterium]
MLKNNPIKISAVSYANTFPFIYGMKKVMDLSTFVLSQDVPAVCAEKLQAGQVDIGLIPLAKLNSIPNAKIISDYCIGAVGEVKTVLLMSRVPLDEIENVYLDPESRSSVNLIKVLAKHYWNKDWTWSGVSMDFPNPSVHQSIVLIGDKTYNHRTNYPYIYDLAEAWTDFTGKPFVFAVWVANRELPNDFLKTFNSALSFGLQNIPSALDVYGQVEQKEELLDYLNNYISYNLDDAKREGMNLFLEFLKELE